MRIREVIKEERNQYTGKKRLSVSDRVNAIQQRLNSIPKNEQLRNTEATRQRSANTVTQVSEFSVTQINGFRVT